MACLTINGGCFSAVIQRCARAVRIDVWDAVRESFAHACRNNEAKVASPCMRLGQVTKVGSCSATDDLPGIVRGGERV